mmetsp:Transcript_19779/g.35865  ORF Transcript_19779/g.35865 Transcript_19779/m.35865 type:complete len:487 (+) Transcript_19779:120-1580(+)
MRSLVVITVCCACSTLASALVKELDHPRRADLRIGTRRGVSNVVSSFQVRPAWSSQSDLDTFVGPTQVVSNFFIAPSEDTELKSLQIATSSSDVVTARVALGGRHGHGRHLAAKDAILLRGGNTLKLVVEYDCHTAGDVNVLLSLDFAKQGVLHIPWQKSCAKRLVDDALLVIADPVEGESKHDVVVEKGRPVWTSEHMVMADVPYSNFTLSLDPLAGHRRVQLGMPKVWTSGACAATPDLGAAHRRYLHLTVQGGVQPQAQFSVAYACAWRGRCTVGVEIPLHSDEALYLPARWQWTKNCDGVASGVDVEVEDEEPSPSSDAMLPSVGMGHQLLVDGQQASLEQWRARPGLSKHSVKLINRANRSLQDAVPVKGLEVRCLSSRHCSAHLLSEVPSLLSAARPSNVDVEYACKMSGSSLVELTLQLESRDAVKLLWVKDCGFWMDSWLGVLLILALLNASFLLIVGMSALVKRSASTSDDGKTECP